MSKHASRRRTERPTVAVHSTVVACVILGFLCNGHLAGAADYKWKSTVSLVNGVPRNCGDDNSRGDRTMEINNTEFKTTSGLGNVTAFDISSLKPDGSGRIVWKNPKSQEVYYDFDAGVGPRKICASSALSSCSWIYTPKS